MLLRWGCFTQLTGDTLHLFGRKLELLLQVDIPLSIDGHEMDVRVVDLKSEDEDSDLATLRHRLDLTGDLLSEDHHAPKQVILDIEDVVDLLARYHERVTGLYGIDVEEGVELSVLGDSIRRDLPLNDACEERCHGAKTRLDRDIEDLKVQEATRRLDLDDITDFAAHEALGDGGVDGDLLLLEVRLGVRDQRIGQLSTRLGIADGDLAQDLDTIGRDLRLVDDTSVSDLCLELSDLPFEEA